MTAYLTVDQAAALLGVSAATVISRCESGEIKATKTGKNWLIDGAALQQSTGTTPGPTEHPDPLGAI
jgi:excisionase family DNA binding protein